MNSKLILFFILSVGNIYSNITIDVSKIGSAVPELYVRKHNKNDIKAIMLGSAKMSKGLQALRLKDISESIRKKINENKRKDKESDSNYFIVARVGDKVITNIDILNGIRFVFFASGQKYNVTSAKLMVESILDSLIDDIIRQRLAKINGINIEDKILDERVNELAKNNNMTLEELEKAFDDFGINMEIFKKNLLSKMIFTEFFRSVERDMKSTPQAIENMKIKIKNDGKERRYRLSEIFLKIDNKQNEQRTLEKAEVILDLLNKGFNFDALKQVVSQSSGIDKIGESDWIKESSLDPVIKNAIKDIKVGEFSEIIKVNRGYKIIYILDKAESGKAGAKQTKYKVLMTTIPSNAINSQEEVNLSNKMNFIAEANSIEQFKKVCSIYKLKIEEKEIIDPTPYEYELIRRNKESNTTGIIKLSENSPFYALFVISEEIPELNIPSDAEINKLILHKKATQDFDKIMKSLQSNNYVKIYKEKLSMVVR